MDVLTRHSPVRLPGRPLEKENRDGFEVVLKYADEGEGPFLVDLSHRSKWDLQDSNIGALKPFGLTVPDTYNQCLYHDGLLINRMNRTQAAIWRLGGSKVDLPKEKAFTETTESQALIALVGSETFSIMEKVSRMDLVPKGRKEPFLVQGPALHIPCQIVVMPEKGGKRAVLVAFSRGYGQSATEALLESGREFDLRPGGESVFTGWLGK